eukprot:5188307-Amphidinium_carterae.1
MAKAKAKAASTERRVQNAMVKHRMRGKQRYDWVHVTRDRFGMETFHPPGELPPSMFKAKTYVVPSKLSDPILPASPNRHAEVRPMIAADPISPATPIRGTLDLMSETGLNTQAIVGDAMEQASAP